MEARRLAHDAHGSATSGGEVMEQAVEAMQQIAGSPPHGGSSWA
jgi:methyl-accepting chemotaxis protein